ncbi:hypothetical protein HQ865_00440 [Mucilaginibacter mali]|uniref:DUF2335 domain-containing protein n=1 Tax=Mucilaginibacter mali TaxID=2740462 RepID=A0A7D4Q057_9SPHI|nr:hypothetical protein [Mucilaginibacter mali]QKJ28287.1 hypothetical protein HQ865_00440 [Mucilaginibacter mali]
MAKQTHSTKQSHIVSQQGKGASFEQHESYDDSLLPEAVELSKLKELDPNIIDWIKSRTEKEQDARLDFNNRKMGLIESSTRKAFAIDMSTIIAAFLVLIAGMFFSAYLISQNMKVEGTVFGGVILIAVVNSFLNFRKNKPTEKKTTNIK